MKIPRLRGLPLTAGLVAVVAWPGLAAAQLAQVPPAVKSVVGQTGVVTDLSAGTVTATGSTTARTLAARAADEINVLDYGAKGNTMAYLDGAMTAGSATLSSSNSIATFVTADVGKAISVDGSGTSGAVQSGTIVSVTNSTHVVLSFSAVTTVSAAQYHYGTDDSAAFVAALNKCQSNLTAHNAVHVPPGFYTIKGTSFPTMSTPCRVVGDGSFQSMLYIDPSYTGTDLFSWSEAWSGNSSNRQGKEVRMGPGLRGLTIAGDLLSTNAVNAINFYDRNDFALIDDVTVQNLNGQCLKTGITKNIVQAYVRESQFYSLRCFSTGTSSAPAVDISSTTTSGSDATNELQFYSLNIFGAKSSGLRIRNPAAYSATRLTYFFGGRVEDSLAGDNVDIGSPSDLGTTANIGFYGFHNINPQSGYYAWKVASGATGTGGSGTSPYNIYIDSPEVGPGAGNGYDIEQGNASIHTGGISVSGTGLTIGASAGNVTLDANGGEAPISKSISGSYTGTFTQTARLAQNGGLSLSPTSGNAFSSTGFSVDASGNATANSLLSATSINSPGIATTGGVTAITMTSGGGTYTAIPTVAISAPTSGAQAKATVATVAMSQWTMVSGGSGYAVNDTLSIQASNCTTPPKVYVTSVSSGVITATGGINGGSCTSMSTGTLAVTGGAGSGATFTLTWNIGGVTVTEPGAGYISVPTVTFTPAAGGIAATASIGAVQTLQAANGKVLLNSSGTTLGVAGTSGGPVLTAGALIDSSGVRTTLTPSGYTVPANTSLVRFTQTSTVSAATVTLPTALADGQAIQFVNYSGAVTALTFSPTVNGWTNASTLAVNTGLRVRWDATAAAWYREQ